VQHLAVGYLSAKSSKHTILHPRTGLGCHTSRRLGGTPLKSVSSASLELVGELERDGLLRVTDTAIEFSHDLLADWARLRVLIVADEEAPQKIKEQAVVPRWIRAIRLYAQRLIEQGNGFTEWSAKTAQLAGEGTDAINARDLFLDGILFATNAKSLLEQVLVRDNCC
jgi:hypothetical protein